MQALNGDHDFEASAILQTFNKHESETNDNATEPNSQKEELKVCYKHAGFPYHNTIFTYKGIECKHSKS